LNDPHTHEWLNQSARVNLVFTFNDWQGVVNGILQCRRCNDFCVIRLLDWSNKNLRTRIFSLASLPDESASVFLRNMNSEYCDLSRKQHETEALYHSLDPVTHIIAIGLPDLMILGVVPFATPMPIKYPDWHTLAPDPANSSWFQLFDLSAYSP